MIEVSPTTFLTENLTLTFIPVRATHTHAQIKVAEFKCCNGNKRSDCIASHASSVCEDLPDKVLYYDGYDELYH